MSSEQRSVANALKPDIYHAKYSEFVNNVLKESSDSFDKEQKLTDAVLLNLYNFFGGVFERALELYEQGRVTHIFPSETIAATSHSDKSNARYLVQVRGLSGEIYTFFPDINYCTCASFRCQVLHDRSLFTCKHILAAWLSALTKDKLSYQYITEKQFQNLLLYQVSYKQHEF